MSSVSPARELTSALVLGGAGFFGQWLLRALIETGAHVVSLDRNPRGRLRGLDVESVQGDVASGDRVLQELVAERRFDIVVDTVGTGSVPRSLQHPLGDLLSNAGTTVAALETLAGVDDPPVLVHTSSAAVYGESVRLPMDEDHPLEPVSHYGISKLAAERYVALYARLHGLPTLSVRLFSLYGPGQRKLAVYDLLARLEAGEDPLVIAGRADVTRDLVFVRDAAQSLLTLGRHASAMGEAYNISSGRATSLDELATALGRVTGRRAEVRFTGALRRGDPLRWEGDPRRSAALGASCRTSLDEGLRQTVAWFRDAAGAQGER
jgi:UDP-glucose 4-epimerase